jgi:UDP-N-acetylmuramoyl-L-alanyl-D-glutamate--2,6-diaminopimelate ligase
MAAMKLADLISGAALDPGPMPAHAADVDINGLAYRSQSVTPGALFFCVRGLSADGHDFAADAAERGAAALVCERRIEIDLPQLIVEDARAAMAPIAACFYGDPSTSLRMIGVTGTNGKTTTSFLIRHILERAGLASGLLGTVESVVAGERREVERTTPEAIDLQQTFREMVDGGDRACVMEVSSHALDLHRADAIAFDCVVFTNLTQDHLDFHGTLEHYFGAKRSLFVPRSGHRPLASVVNLDDEWGRRLAGELGETGQTKLVSFAVGNDADYRAEHVSTTWQGTGFDCVSPEGIERVELPQPGLFNVYNAIAAIAAAGCVGVSAAAAAAALGDSPRVPGRLEAIEEGQAFGVLVDYAHTPDSLENVLLCARELLQTADAPTAGRLICVFGAGGDRDAGKRPLMGESARSLSDLIVVTSDNPRSEDPDRIVEQIVEGARGAGDSGATVLVEVDRRAAIEQALGSARAGDLVVIAGKGHEQGQEFADGKKIPFDDRAVTRELLRELMARQAP